MYARVLLGLFLMLSSLMAGDDKFKISLGGMFVTEFETEMQISNEYLPVGARINTKDQLDMEAESQVFRLDGSYRFTDTHSIEFTYFSVKSNSFKQLNRNIEFDGKVIEAGAMVDTYFDMDIYKINYMYSFYHNDKVELGLLVGLHITTVDLGLSASGTIDGQVRQSYKSDTSPITLPLPVFGFKGEYAIIKHKLYVNYKVDYLFLEYDNFKGKLMTSALNLEYNVMDHFGVGIGYNTNKIYVEDEDGNNNIEVLNVLSGAMVYVSYRY
jgi:hypothetical protein